MTFHELAKELLEIKTESGELGDKVNNHFVPKNGWCNVINAICHGKKAGSGRPFNIQIEAMVAELQTVLLMK